MRRTISIVYGLLLLAFAAFTILEGFVIPQTYAVVEQETQTSEASEHSWPRDGSAAQSQTEQAADSSAEVTDTSYTTEDKTVTIKTYRENDTTIYVADVVLKDSSDLKTAFANDVYGKNVTATTSSIAASHNAILAINGDYYSARTGYIIRNGEIYSSESGGEDQEDLVIYQDGSMEVIREGDTTAEELLENGAVQVMCFGPGLVEDGEVAVSDGEEVGQSMRSNPRTAIGWISDNHYVLVVSDGRTSESAGLSLYQLAQFMDSLGCKTAYNLDGGGSSTMVFNGNVINNPTSGHGIKERSVSDIVYISQ